MKREKAINFMFSEKFVSKTWELMHKRKNKNLTQMFREILLEQFQKYGIKYEEEK